MTLKLVRISKMEHDYRPPKAHLASSYQFFCEYLRHRMGFANSPMPLYKHYILQAMDDASNRLYTPNILIEEPRSHAKTTMDIEPYAPWRWLKEPWLRVGVWSTGEVRAKRIVQGIIRIIEHYLPEYYSVEYAKTLELRLKHTRPYDDPSLECFPILGSSTVGSGKDIIICDDVYTTEGIDYSSGGFSDLKSGKILDRFDRLTDLWREYSRPMKITVGTPLHVDDLYNQMECGKMGPVRVLKFPVMPDAIEAQMPKAPIDLETATKWHKHVIWPNIFQPIKLMSAYNSPARWKSQYMLQPESGVDAVFLPENISYSQETINLNAFKQISIVIDPATPKTRGQKGDLCAMIVGGITKDNTWHIIDGWAEERYKIEELQEVWSYFMLKYCRTDSYGRRVWPPTIIEAAGQQELMIAPLQMAANKKPILNRNSFIMQTTGNVKKALRIEGYLSPVIAQKRLVIHKCPIAQELISELKGFPGFPRKDVADACAALVKYCARNDDYWYPQLSGIYGIGEGEDP